MPTLPRWSWLGLPAGVAVAITLAALQPASLSPECVDHLPDTWRSVELQCQLGARLRVVDHVAVCVCPAVKP